jgi:hypothetical protein
LSLQRAEGSKGLPNRMANCPTAAVHSIGRRRWTPALRIARNSYERGGKPQSQPAQDHQDPRQLPDRRGGAEAVFAIVSTTSIPYLAPMSPTEATVDPPSRGSRLDADHPENGVLNSMPIHKRAQDPRRQRCPHRGGRRAQSMPSRRRGASPTRSARSFR